MSDRRLLRYALIVQLVAWPLIVELSSRWLSRTAPGEEMRSCGLIILGIVCIVNASVRLCSPFILSPKMYRVLAPMTNVVASLAGLILVPIAVTTLHFREGIASAMFWVIVMWQVVTMPLGVKS